jgi:U6 snRNA phosphodiesterase
MSLVDYSDSESESDPENRTRQQALLDDTGKRKADHIDSRDVGLPRSRPPPSLPDSFHSLYAANSRASTSDDPSLHAGRTRQIPHVVGNWPTHVYLEWYPSKAELAILKTAIERCGHELNRCGNPIKLHTFLQSELGAQLPLHISLSAPLVLKTEQKDLFQDSITSGLYTSKVNPFHVRATTLDWVANQDKSRFFLVLKLAKPTGDELNKLLWICNAVADQFDLPLLYSVKGGVQTGLQSGAGDQKNGQTADKSHAFHISVAWTLDEPNDEIRRHLANAQDDQLGELKVSFSILKLKLGNTVVDLPFAENLLLRK